jgi:TatD family-associated radical SAM protein
MNTVVYPLGSGLYINLTNRCNNACTFCVRNEGQGVGGYDLWLEHEPEADEVKTALMAYDLTQWQEVVYCGFGEPTLRLEVLLEVAAWLRERAPHLTQRLNTNGLANLQADADVTHRLRGLLDTVSVSLNEATAEDYDRLCRPAFGLAAFPGLMEFARRCQAQGIQTVLSVVDVIGPEKVAACRALAEEAGIPLRVRAYIP